MQLLPRVCYHIKVCARKANPQAVVRQTSHMAGLENVSVHMVNLSVRKCSTFMDGVSVVGASLTISMDSDTEKAILFFFCIINLKKGGW